MENNVLNDAATMFRSLSKVYVSRSGNNTNNQTVQVVVSQLEDMAELLDKYAKAKDIEVNNKKINEKIIGRELECYGLKVKDIELSVTLCGYVKVSLEIKAGSKNKNMNICDLEQILSELLQKDMCSGADNNFYVQDEYSNYVFMEDGRYEVLYGLSRANKNKSLVSGDSFITKKLNNGKILIGIMDGMGAGTEAFKESKMAIELMEQAIDAGFSEKTAIDMVNMSFSLNDNEGIPVSVDLCSIDTFSGMCNCIKLGAVSTYILRKDWVDVIVSNTMPIGVLPEIDYDCIAKKLYDGEFVVMVSDGVLEALPFLDKEKVLLDIIQHVKKRNPEQIAKEILEGALEYIGDYPCDDMTIIVAGIYERTHYYKSRE